MSEHSNRKMSFLSRAIENAVAQQCLEGLHPSKELIDDLEQVASGQLTVETVIANIGKRYKNVQILGQ